MTSEGAHTKGPEETGKSGILLGITLNPRKCIGEKVRRIPINVETAIFLSVSELMDDCEGNVNR